MAAKKVYLAKVSSVRVFEGILLAYISVFVCKNGARKYIIILPDSFVYYFAIMSATLRAIFSNFVQGHVMK